MYYMNNCSNGKCPFQYCEIDESDNQLNLDKLVKKYIETKRKKLPAKKEQSIKPMIKPKDGLKIIATPLALAKKGNLRKPSAR